MASMNGDEGRSSAESQATPGKGSSTLKRKSEDGSGTQTRSKRNRYISIACNECKRRKIKCNGQVPCQRCGNLSLECLYAPNCCSSSFKDSDEFRQMKSHITSLQEQVDALFANLNNLRQQQDATSPMLDSGPFMRDASRTMSMSQTSFQNGSSPAQSRTKFPRFRGPTSAAFNFDVAKSSLQTMGITQSEDGMEDGTGTLDPSPMASPPHMPRALPPPVIHPTKDPLYIIGREEAIRLCRVYDEEMGIMYPMLDIERVVRQTHSMYNFMEAAARTGLAVQNMPGADGLGDDDTNILKMVLATAMLTEGAGQSELGQRLFESVRRSTEMRLWDAVETKGLIILALVAMYFFHMDEEGQAWRIIGLAARLTLEMGLHRREALIRSFPIEDECSWALKLFWSIYTLDRRWSFGTGMPFALQDMDIDPFLPEPDESTPYLKAMIQYSRIGSKIWYSGVGFDGVTDVKKDEIGYLDYQVLQWHKQIPDCLRYYDPGTGREIESATRGSQRLRVLIYLRANQMRILIYRPVLHSATSVMENRGYAQTVVDVAKDTIRVLTRLNQISNIYRTQQVCFNYFLVSALAVLFLAVSHAPIEFNKQVRDEFYMALDIVKGFSTKSYNSKRLWRAIRGLREIGEKLGLPFRTANGDPNDAHSTAAIAMAGLAGHPMNELPVYPPVQGSNELGSSPMNGLQMSNELTSLFEAAGGYGNFMAANGGTDSMNGYPLPEGEVVNGVEGVPAFFGNEEEFSRIMRDLF